MSVSLFAGVFIGVAAWFMCVASRWIYTVDQNERAVMTTFGRAERVGSATTLDDPISAKLDDEEKQRLQYRRCGSSCRADHTSSCRGRKVYKVSIATQTVNMAFDTGALGANQGVARWWRR